MKNFLKNFFKKIILEYFKIVSFLVLRFKKPLIIGVTGSAGKTTTKEMIAFMLENYANLSEKLYLRLRELNFKPHKKIFVFKNFESLNNEFGIPLTIFLASFRPGNDFFKWLKIIYLSLIVFFRRYPDILVLELGVERPGDMAYFMKFIRPHIGIFTLLGEFPAHLQFFAKKEDVAKEKGLLIENTQLLAILNFDDPLIKELSSKTKAKVFSFGKNSDVDLQILQPSKYKIFNQIIEIEIKPYSDYGIYFDIPLVVTLGILKFLDAPESIFQFFTQFQPLAGRLKILKTQIDTKEITFFDDTYNASPASYFYLFELAKKINEKKLGVLADVLECDSEAQKIHELLGEKMNFSFDRVILVGERLKLFAEKKIKIPYDIFIEPEWEKIYLKIKELIVKENFKFIFFKGARGFHLEKILDLFGFQEKTVKCFCNYRPNAHNLSFKGYFR